MFLRETGFMACLCLFDSRFRFGYPQPSMIAMTFDTLSVAKRLKSSGFSEPQAEAVAREIQEAASEDHLVTRDYLKNGLEKFELRIVLKLGGMIVALGGLLTAIKYFG